MLYLVEYILKLCSPINVGETYMRIGAFFLGSLRRRLLPSGLNSKAKKSEVAALSGACSRLVLQSIRLLTTVDTGNRTILARFHEKLRSKLGACYI
jgi:hypothetical protein